MSLLPRLLRLIRPPLKSQPLHVRQLSNMANVSSHYTAERVNEILSGKYPAKAHAEKVASYLRDADPSITDGLIYLESQKARLHEDCDQEGMSIPSFWSYPMMLTSSGGYSRVPPAPSILLLLRLQPPGQLRYLSHLHQDADPLHPASRPRRGHLVRPSPLTRAGSRKVRCRRRPPHHPRP